MYNVDHTCLWELIALCLVNVNAGTAGSIAMGVVYERTGMAGMKYMPAATPALHFTWPCVVHNEIFLCYIRAEYSTAIFRLMGRWTLPKYSLNIFRKNIRV